jgi:hypothetical protein
VNAPGPRAASRCLNSLVNVDRKSLIAILMSEAEPGAHEHAVVLAPVKERPGNIAASFTVNLPAVLDSRSTRQPRERAGRDEKMLSYQLKGR